MAQLPPMDLFGALLFQVTGQQLSVAATRRTLARIEALFGGHLPSPTELLAVDPGKLREAWLSWRKISTLRDLAGRPTDGRLNQDALSKLPDDELIAELTTIPGDRLSDGTLIRGRAVLFARGGEWRRLEVPGVDDLLDARVGYRAGPSEALACTGSQVVVVGGGNSAGQAVVRFSRYAKRVPALSGSQPLPGGLARHRRRPPRDRIWLQLGEVRELGVGCRDGKRGGSEVRAGPAALTPPPSRGVIRVIEDHQALRAV